MAAAAGLIADYQVWIYAALGLAALFYLALWWRASRGLRVAIYGLERESVYGRRNQAAAMLIILSVLVLSVYVVSNVIVPNVDYLTPPTATPRATHTPVPSATPVRSAATAGPGTAEPTLSVDSSGCDNPHATLTAPTPHERITGTYEVRGTADLSNFGFYKFEIAGDNTGGAWVPLGVGTAAVTDAALGTFDSSAYLPGEYAFRLVVLDSAGNAPTACVVAVTFVAPVVPQ
jgi:hypothetical protein